MVGPGQIWVVKIGKVVTCAAQGHHGNPSSPKAQACSTTPATHTSRQPQQPHHAPARSASRSALCFRYSSCRRFLSSCAYASRLVARWPMLVRPASCDATNHMPSVPYLHTAAHATPYRAVALSHTCSCTRNSALCSLYAAHCASSSARMSWIFWYAALHISLRQQQCGKHQRSKAEQHR